MVPPTTKVSDLPVPVDDARFSAENVAGGVVEVPEMPAFWYVAMLQPVGGAAPMPSPSKSPLLQIAWFTTSVGAGSESEPHAATKTMAQPVSVRAKGRTHHGSTAAAPA